MEHRRATGWDFLPATPGDADGGAGEFAQSQQAGLNAIISLARPAVPRQAVMPRPAVPPQASHPVDGAVTDRAPARPASAGTAPGADATVPRHRFWHLPGLSVMVVILTTQAVLSLRLLHASTAFGDEALYLWAGHLEWAHWLHHTSLPAFPTWFSGSPVIYPPIGALADSIGGLAAARVLSLCFMLVTTCLLWGTTARLFGRRPAYFAAALFAVIGPTLHLGAFATYDPMALCLVALAAWCACGARTKQDATGWILTSAAALALANATKYASAIFDPVVLVMAVLSAYPMPGGKAAMRRGSLLLTFLAGLLAVLLRFGGSWYLTGISQTTTRRPNGGAPVARVLAESWQWTAVIVVAALAGVLLGALRRDSRPVIYLMAALTAAAALVPAEQARIATTVSLSKHVDFGAWFAAIVAGYALSCLVTWLRPRFVRLLAAAGLSAAVVLVAGTGVSQARSMVNWPGASDLIPFLRPLTSHGGHFLAETDDVPEYYLPLTSWRQWSNTFSITTASGQVINVDGSPLPYLRAIRRHYFSVIVLSFSETPVMDRAITGALRATPGYQVVGIVPYGGQLPGYYTVWAYRPGDRHGGA